jgi:hypothetical protein
MTLVQAQYMKGLNGQERDDMQRIMSEEFQPGYHADLWCPPCVSDMILTLYRLYDAWLAAQPPESPITVQASFPKHYPPAEVESEPQQQPKKKNHQRK